jgi:dethiobiotin synthetase
MADWVAGHRWPVLLVVGIRLGCINHALLSAESILRRTPLVGWVANGLPPRADAADEIIQTLRACLPAPLLGTVGVGADARQTAVQLAGIDLVQVPA